MTSHSDSIVINAGDLDPSIIAALDAAADQTSSINASDLDPRVIAALDAADQTFSVDVTVATSNTTLQDLQDESFEIISAGKESEDDGTISGKVDSAETKTAESKGSDLRSGQFHKEINHQSDQTIGIGTELLLSYGPRARYICL
jgi:hypothetical protein